MVEKIIGGNRFTVAPLTAMRSFVLQPRLAPVIAEVAALVFAALESDAVKELMGAGADGGAVDLKAMTVDQFMSLDLDLGAHADQLVNAVSRICTKLPPKELEGITRELLQGAQMDGKFLFGDDGNPFDVLMRGRTIDTWRLLFFAVQVNYPDVFSRRAANGGATPAPGSASAVSTT
jgi:hypothetical protein